MSDISDTKPQPIAAKPNWNYDSYFLAQLERINQQTRKKLSKKTAVGDVQAQTPESKDD